MQDIIINYVLPNIILFGGIFLICKIAEIAVWKTIVNYDEIVKTFNKI